MHKLTSHRRGLRRLANLGTVQTANGCNAFSTTSLKTDDVIFLLT